MKYVDEWSPLLDLKILRTLAAPFTSGLTSQPLEAVDDPAHGTR